MANQRTASLKRCTLIGREMTKHKIGKEKWEKKKKNKEKANFSLFADKKRKNQLFR
jgi:hypothetical protein